MVIVKFNPRAHQAIEYRGTKLRSVPAGVVQPRSPATTGRMSDRSDDGACLIGSGRPTAATMQIKDIYINF